MEQKDTTRKRGLGKNRLSINVMMAKFRQKQSLRRSSGELSVINGTNRRLTDKITKK